MRKLLLISLLACSAIALASGRHVHAGRNPCKKAGFFALVENTPEFYGCYRNGAGGLIVQYLSCRPGHVFTSDLGYCVPNVQAIGPAQENLGIMLPTTPEPEGDDETEEKPDTATDPVSSEPESTEEVPGSEDNTTEKPDPTESPEEPEVTTPGDSTDESEGTVEPESTPGPGSTDDGTDTTITTDDGDITTDDGSVTTDDGDITTDDGSITTDDGDITTDDGIQPFICPSTGFFPSSEGCDKFVYCTRESGELKAYALSCPEGQQFNFAGKYCDAEFDCHLMGAQTHHEVEVEAENDCLVEGTFPHKRDCSKYYTCTWNQQHRAFKISHEFCRENEVFDTLTGRCGREDRLTCQGRPENSRFV